MTVTAVCLRRVLDSAVISIQYLFDSFYLHLQRIVAVTGRLCETDVDDCVGEPCQHDGTCDDLHNGFSCRCLPGFTGKLCSEVIERDDNAIDAPYVLESAEQLTDQVA